MEELHKSKLHSDNIFHIPNWQNFGNLIIHSIHEAVETLLYIVGEMQNDKTPMEGNLVILIELPIHLSFDTTMSHL